MNLNQVKTAIETAPKGALIIVEWSRPVKTRKAFNDVPLVKDVRMVGRINIDYEKLGAVKNKRETGELPPVNQGLRGEQFFESDCIILNPNNGNRYLRLYNGISKTTHPAVQYRIGNTVVSKESVEDMMLASEKRSSHGECFQVNVANIRRIHTETADDADVAETPQETAELSNRISEQAIRWAKEEEIKSLQEAIDLLQDDFNLFDDSDDSDDMTGAVASK